MKNVTIYRNTSSRRFGRASLPCVGGKLRLFWIGPVFVVVRRNGKAV